MRSPSLRASLPSALVACTLLFAACGDDEGSSSSDDTKLITERLTTALTSKDAAAQCEQSLSDAFIERSYQTAAKCREQSKDDKPATKVDTSDVKVDGDKATAVIKVTGGESDGASGQVVLARAGDDWKVDDLSIEYLRSNFERAIRTSEDIPSSVQDCVLKAVDDLEDAELRELAFGAIGEQPDAEKQFVELYTKCASEGGEEGEPSALREQFEEGIAGSMEKDGRTAEQIECVKRELRDSITDEQITEAVGKGRDDLPPEITKATANALIECDAT